MSDRREFLGGSIAATIVGLSGLSSCQRRIDKELELSKGYREPIVISTWKHGLAANEAAWAILSGGGRALDAVEEGVKVSENDPEVMSVGYGGLPDRDGNVTLDACIMDDSGNCGSVAFLENIKNPISVARLVMEKTPHIMLVGEGALEFALANGFKKENLLTEKAKQKWQEWLKESGYEVKSGIISEGIYRKADYYNDEMKTDVQQGAGNFSEVYEVQVFDATLASTIHDTIGMVALDKSGNLSGACTTSGLAWKYHGRVGDSPIIGAGLYVDNEVGGAVATGKGEAVIKIAGSFLIVELMRQGYSPQSACSEAIKRISSKQRDWRDFQVGFLALNKDGQIGGYSLQKGFQYALYAEGKNELYDSKCLIES
jgi:isoaspartyl peptidase/L-asparaginase-like protein (Ntn-hydrolase superfamily)